MHLTRTVTQAVGGIPLLLLRDPIAGSLTRSSFSSLSLFHQNTEKKGKEKEKAPKVSCSTWVLAT